MSRKIINNLVMNLYVGEIEPKELLFIIDYDKILLREILYELMRLGYDDIIEKLIIEQSRNLLEYCYTLDVDK